MTAAHEDRDAAGPGSGDSGGGSGAGGPEQVPGPAGPPTPGAPHAGPDGAGETGGAHGAESGRNGTRPRTLCVFCGAGAGVRPDHVLLAARLGRACARQGVRVVYGAGGVGVMGALSDAVLAEGGHITGVIPQALMDREYGRRDLTSLRIVRSMHERKALMHALSDAYLTLPGGYGTLEELFEVTAWAQLRLHRKPVVLLSDNGFFAPLVRMLDHARDEGFVSAEDRRLVRHATTVDEALRYALRELPEPGGAQEPAALGSAES